MSPTGTDRITLTGSLRREPTRITPVATSSIPVPSRHPCNFGIIGNADGTSDAIQPTRA